MGKSCLDISGRKVGPGQPCFVIAEAGVNHNGSMDMARQLIDVAAAAGADAVKFQTFSALRLVTPDAPKAGYQAEQTGDDESQFTMLKRLQLSPENHRELINHCESVGVLFMSTPFSEEDADLLDELGVAVFKIPSGEVTNLPYLAHIARKNKPMVVSTGMASLGEVEAAVDAIEATGNDQFVLLHCVSNYPADPADVNLRAMNTMAQAFGTAAGYSDHTLGNEVSLSAVAMGACVIEKHFTLDRSLPGPDHRASSEPQELTDLIRGIRKVESALGTGRKCQVASEANTASVARKSLVAATDIAAGAALTDENIVAKRPGTGLPPTLKPYFLGRSAKASIPAGTLLSLDQVA